MKLKSINEWKKVEESSKYLKTEIESKDGKWKFKVADVKKNIDALIHYDSAPQHRKEEFKKKIQKIEKWLADRYLMFDGDQFSDSDMLKKHYDTKFSEWYDDYAESFM